MMQKQKPFQRFIKFTQKVDPKKFNIAGVNIISLSNNELVLNVFGDLNPLIETLARLKIENIVFPEPSLEETFMTFYEQTDYSAPISG